MKHQNKQQKKQEIHWTRILNKWGHSDAGMDDLYEQGDAIHGKGFEAFLRSIVIHRDIYTKDNPESKATNLFSALKDNQTISSYKDNVTKKTVPNLADIMREQRNGIP
ncbi:MAG: hypothetical protein CL870_03975 [Cytophagia bacterium]|nr:hypothetical protein [Cytophagia bacterium]|tara:strand:- start:376 stop:699 length:324 start_codon:yes stop_codon:yes gene_type:complete